MSPDPVTPGRVAVRPLLGRSGLALVRRPDLWRAAVRQARRLAPARWWARPPFLPLPDPGYLAFRLETMYGDDRRPEGADLVTYLEWCRAIEGHLPVRRRDQPLP